MSVPGEQSRRPKLKAVVHRAAMVTQQFYSNLTSCKLRTVHVRNLPNMTRGNSVVATMVPWFDNIAHTVWNFFATKGWHQERVIPIMLCPLSRNMLNDER